MLRREIIQQAIELGRLHGCVTFNQLNELLPAGTHAAPEDIEALLEALRDEGINVIEGN